MNRVVARTLLATLARDVARLAAQTVLDPNSRTDGKRRAIIYPNDLSDLLPSVYRNAAYAGERTGELTKTEVEFLRNLAADIEGREIATVAPSRPKTRTPKCRT
jgi:hypothetical protein